MKVTNKEVAFELCEKRFNLPATIDGVCPKCGSPFSKNYEDHYLSYPFTNKDMTEHLYCSHCEHEWNVKIRLTLKLEIVD